jgi:NAD(P)-dependent dehydrogenase (short-subunit alcohol dehydrogenase family)
MKNYLIIGGTKGIGKALVELCLKNEASLYVVSRNCDEVSNQNIHSVSLDITSESIPVDFLPESLDGLVYCPGSINLKPFNRLTPADFDQDWQINFMGAVKSIQLALPALKKSPNASIVLFSTVAVSTGMPFHASIGAAKGAVEGLTKSLAAEFAPKIRVNCIAPSLTNTQLAERLLSTEEKVEAAIKRNPLNKIGDPSDLAAMAYFLLSENSSWITGQVMHVDGGMSCLKV